MGFVIRRNYETNSIEFVVDYIHTYSLKNMTSKRYANYTEEEAVLFNKRLIELESKNKLIVDGKCYVGITSNPIMSLKAHNIDIYDESAFNCFDIPQEKSEQCKKIILDLNDFEGTTDEANDYIDDSCSIIYLYIYKITDNTVQKIDTTDFTPLKKMPERPIIINFVYIDNKQESVYFDENNNDYEKLISEIEENFYAHKLVKLTITHRNTSFMEFEFGIDCSIINFDNNTSQSGGFQTYRSGEKSRKKVKIFTGEYPEYMLCRDIEVMKNIMLYFMVKGNKPGKRQNIKWVNATRKQLVL